MSYKNRTRFGNIAYTITLIFLIVMLYFAYQYYQTNNFNDFVRSEKNLYTSEFKRDSEIKYNNQRSYKISSAEYNDAMFYKNIKVEKDTPYRVRCMVKTKNVTSEEEKAGVGAEISIEGATERSVAIQGTNDWQEIELIFNSKNRESVNIGFRLGGNLGQAKGEVWFSNFTIEEGVAEQNNDWKFACFILNTTDVEINNEQIKLEVTKSDKNDIKNTIRLFENLCKTLSEEKMTAECDIYEIEEPLTKLSYDEEFGYYVSPEDVETHIKDTISKNTYDHIFIIVRLRR